MRIDETWHHNAAARIDHFAGIVWHIARCKCANRAVVCHNKRGALHDSGIVISDDRRGVNDGEAVGHWAITPLWSMATRTLRNNSATRGAESLPTAITSSPESFSPLIPAA